MDHSQILSYPEIELGRPDAELQRMHERADLLSLTTSADVLEVHSQPELSAKWTQHLGHDQLLQHFDKEDHLGGALAKPTLHVLFFDSRNGVLQAHPSTVNWLQRRFHVSPVFLEYVLSRRRGATGKTGTACFSRRDENGNVVSIDGFYSLTHGFNFPAVNSSRVWFSHDLSRGSATYVVIGCLKETKDCIVTYAFGPNIKSLTRHCIIDAFIANASSYEWADCINHFRRQLLSYESGLPSTLQANTDYAVEVQTLHEISKAWHIIHADFTDAQEVLEFILDIHNKYFSPVGLGEHSAFRNMAGETTVDESLTHLIARNRIWQRWVANYNERTMICINLFFNLVTQKDSRTNLDIAHLTSQISISTQRDSSSMITIAVVTMSFLPATFVSAIFSTVFFSTNADAHGRETLTLSSQCWYFVVVTIPLTVLVFVIWILSTRHREARQLKS